MVALNPISLLRLLRGLELGIEFSPGKNDERR